MKTKLTLATILAIVSVAIVCWTPRTPDEPQPKVAVFGRTLCPWCPPVVDKVAVFGRTLCPWCPPVVDKRISLSGEGVFVRPLAIAPRAVKNTPYQPDPAPMLAGWDGDNCWHGNEQDCEHKEAPTRPRPPRVAVKLRISNSIAAIAD